MNIFWRELRAGRKAFLLWMAGMFLLCFAGIVKFESYSTAGGMDELIAAFPRVVLAVMGITGLDINTLAGYTALLYYYVLVFIAVYAVMLGAGAVTRESIDRTHEFLFTKPRTRRRILGAKLAAAGAYLILFCLMNAAFAYGAALTLADHGGVEPVIAACTLAALLVSFLFAALGAFLATLIEKPEKGASLGSRAFLAAFVLGAVYNMLEAPGVLRAFSPFSYFLSADLAGARVHPLYALLAISLTFALLFGAFRRFERRNLT
jgi:ABC-2 type transport system permease protein